MKAFLPVLPALMAALAAAGPAMAQDQYFEIVNQSPRALLGFYATPTHIDHWGGDLLGGEALAAGAARQVRVADNQTTCVYDLRFVMEGGHAVEYVHDICAVGQFVLR